MSTLTGQDFAESTLRHLCKLLEKLEHFELLRHCAKTAFAKWQEPIWMYYRVYADNNGKPEDCTLLSPMDCISSIATCSILVVFDKDSTVSSSFITTLNVATTANDAEIKQAYLRLVKDNPPDRNQEKFQLIHDAYSACSILVVFDKDSTVSSSFITTSSER
jgi:hypothetical protein